MDRIKVIAKETLLAYPNFNARFDIHTDASQTQLGAVISQDGIPIAFYYSRKLNPAQTRYTTTEKEILSIVETLKEFRNILLGQQVRVYTDHKNLTCIVEWYYNHLCHRGIVRTEATIRKYFYWKGLRQTVLDGAKQFVVLFIIKIK